MTDDHGVPCPGPHHTCRGCGGPGLVPSSALYITAAGAAAEMSRTSTCRACRGRGHFCKAPVPCPGPHHAGTPVLPPEALPPV
ncbi:hypothetical protein [Streptomyces pactum]|uniref:hypothetical protein n=1 Tax=Streptomyces pactum TaxID=68249 RepID=UPI0036F90E70